MPVLFKEINEDKWRKCLPDEKSLKMYIVSWNYPKVQNYFKNTLKSEIIDTFVDDFKFMNFADVFNLVEDEIAHDNSIIVFEISKF